MTIDLWMLLAAVGLTWGQILLSAVPPLLGDMSWGVGNRDTPPERPPWSARADRAANNMKENLPLFTALVLLVHVSGSANQMSAWGAEIFVAARIAYAGIYVAGIPVARTLAWAVSVVGMLMIASAAI